MSRISRRTVLSSGLALSTASLVSRQGWARAAAFLATSDANPASGGAISPRERLRFDFGWKFQLGNASDPAKDMGFVYNQEAFSKTGDFKFAHVGYDDASWRSVNLPHDWAVELPFVWDDTLLAHGFKPLGRRYPETSVGWYRREFDIPASDAGRRITVEFDGAVRDVLVFVNGCFIGRNDNAYTPFQFDIADFLAVGQKNCIVVRADASYGDGWFYEGAGIYRHMWLTKTDSLHFAPLESVARVTMEGQFVGVELATRVENHTSEVMPATVSWEIFGPDGKTANTADTREQPVGPCCDTRFSDDGFLTSAHIDHPMFWSVESPNLYAAVATLKSGGVVRDVERITFGIRTVKFDADHGFFLNGQPMKIQGTCNHQDHAGVGAAVPDRIQAFRVAVLQGMGCNAIRTSHNMPTPELVEACDRMGMMMMLETRQMSSSPEGLAQLETMVKRYRNSPSIIIWSIGNEEWRLQSEESEEGAKIARTMVDRCHELDPTRVVGAAVNGDNEKGVSDPLDIVGFNYGLNRPDGYHKEHPSRPIYGSETASTISVRGSYQTDALRNTLSAYDVNHTAWSQLAEEWWKFYATREWEAGGFAWTGFDYRGEPTPYGWPTINSNFGIVDTCGFPKDNYFYYKSWWTKEPVLHLFPHWNWEGREGEEIPVWVHSNLDEVELFLNGTTQGRQKVPHLGHVEWKVRYQPGRIEARGYKEGKIAHSEIWETTGPVASLRLTADRTVIDADGEDVVVLKVDALDSASRAVPTAQNLISFKVIGDGALIGVGNGDPNCHESDKDPKRSLFNGLAQAIVQSTKTPGSITIEASTLVRDKTVTPASITITTNAINLRPTVA